MSNPLVSVIIPCFNAERWIGDAIESALRQTYEPIEVIIVDDGSTDGSLAVARSFGRRVKCETCANRGACAARNRGLEVAQGEYIQFLDADDLLHPEKVERQLAVLRDLPDSLVYCLHRVVSLEPGKVAAMQWNRRDPSDDPVVFMFRGDLPTPAPLHRRATIDKIGGFDGNFPCADDREFHFRLALGGIHFIPLPEVLFTIRRHSGSIGISNERRTEEQRGYIALRVYKELESRKQLTNARELACGAMLMRAARGLYHSNPLLAHSFADRACRIDRRSIHESYSRLTRTLLTLVGRENTERLVRRYRSWLNATDRKRKPNEG